MNGYVSLTLALYDRCLPVFYYIHTCTKQYSLIRPATRCDGIGHFAAISRVLEASQTIAAHRRFLLKNYTMWPVDYSRWNVFIFSCDVHRSDDDEKCLTGSIGLHIT